MQAITSTAHRHFQCSDCQAPRVSFTCPVPVLRSALTQAILLDGPSKSSMVQDATTKHIEVQNSKWRYIGGQMAAERAGLSDWQTGLHGSPAAHQQPADAASGAGSGGKLKLRPS